MKTQIFIILCLLFFTTKVFSYEPLSISGVVSDAKNGKAINDVNIVVEEKETGTLSNYNGAYLLYLQEGKYEITFTGKGYYKKQISLNLTDNQELMVELSPKLKLKKKKVSLTELAFLSKK
jgi:hypothetical protein